MKKYESLTKLYYKRKNIEAEYQARINSPSAYVTNLKISSIVRGERTGDEFPLFYSALPEMFLEQEKIFTNSKKILKLSSNLPALAREACIKDIMMNEVNRTNGIEGVHSTKKELYEGLNKKDNRYSGIVNKYAQIKDSNIEKITKPIEIKELYEEIFKEDILEDENKKLDGVIFRKDVNHISDSTNKVIHTGDLTEKMILVHMEDLISFMNNKEVPSLVKGAIVHYYFEYIHPFYDGNGRFGRFLFSSYLAKKIDVYTGLSLSYAIFGDKKLYSDVFVDTSNSKNCGDATFFVIQMLDFIVKGQKNIIEMLKDKTLKLKYSEEYINSIPELKDVEKEILLVYIQSYIFAKEDPMTDEEVLVNIGSIKSLQTLRNYVKKLEGLGFVEKIENKPIKRAISLSLQERLD